MGFALLGQLHPWRYQSHYVEDFALLGQLHPWRYQSSYVEDFAVLTEVTLCGKF